MAALFVLIISPLREWKLEGVYLLTVGYSLQGICISLLVLFAILKADGRLGRILNAPAVVWVGGLSYSLYLWQQLFIGFNTYSTRQSMIGLLFVLPAAAASYYLVEKPMLKVKGHFKRRRARLRTRSTAGAVPASLV